MKCRLVFLFPLLMLFACQQEYFAPLIITGAVSGIDSSGAVFNARITSLGEKPVVEFGFVWDTLPDPNIKTAEKYGLNHKPKTGNLTVRITSGLIPDKMYFVRAFIRTDFITTYGEETRFLSRGGSMPEITSIEPLSGNLGNTLAIYGKNFSSRSCEVKIDQITAKILRMNQDSLFVIVPNTLLKRKSQVTITSLDQLLVARDSFTLIATEITGFEPGVGTYGDEIIIKGNMFSKNRGSLKVSFDKTSSSFSFVDDQTLRASVPNNLNVAQCHINVEMNNQTTSSEALFSLMPVEVDDFNPKIAKTGEKITITGRNFNPNASMNRVYIGNVLTKPFSVSKNSLIVILPQQDSVVYETRYANVKVLSGGVTRIFEDKLTINDPWFRRADVPYELRHETYICSTCPPMISYRSAHSFVVGKTAYIGLNANKNFWAFHTETNTWRKLSDFPGTPRVNATGFVYGDKIFIGTGENDNNYTQLYVDWWEYDTTTDRWTRKADFPFGARSSLKAFATGSGFYLAQGFYWNQNTGYGLNLWKYNPDSDIWTVEVVDVQNLKRSLPWRLAKPVNNDVYVAYMDYQYASVISFYIYKPDTKSFTAIQSFPYRNTFGRVNSMVLNNRIYVQAYDYDETSKNFYYYDVVSKTWKICETNIDTDISYGISFEAGNLGYVGMGSQNRLYEFDPNR